MECGSQFSVALTRSGAVYTWGKGDYHRLGHGTEDHVRLELIKNEFIIWYIEQFLNLIIN